MPGCLLKIRMRIYVKQRSNRYLVVILVVSVVLRLAAAIYLGDEIDAPPLLTDQRSYHALGARLVAGQGFSFERNWYPFTPADTPTAHWSFLYSLFVAGIYALFGPHPLAVRLIQAVLGGILLPWGVFRLARVIFALSLRGRSLQGRSLQGRSLQGRSLPQAPPRVLATASPPADESVPTVPLLAALIAALYGYYILYAATLMTETSYIILVLWSLEAGLKAAHCLGEEKPIPLALGLQLGISLGLAALVRQSILPWVPVMGLYLLWLARRSRQTRRLWPAWPTLRALTAAGIVVVACIAPFTLRNYLVYGQFLLLNSNTGYAMYSAQHPMHGTAFREFDAAPLPEGWWGRPEPELDRDLLRQGIRFVLDEPGRYLLLSLNRARALFEFWPTPGTSLLHNIGRTGSFGLLLPFLLYGLFLALRRQGFMRHNGLLFLFAISYTLLHLATWAMVRYRLAIDAALMPLAALAVADLVQRVRLAIPRRVSRTRTDQPA